MPTTSGVNFLGGLNPAKQGRKIHGTNSLEEFTEKFAGNSSKIRLTKSGLQNFGIKQWRKEKRPQKPPTQRNDSFSRPTLQKHVRNFSVLLQASARRMLSGFLRPTEKSSTMQENFGVINSVRSRCIVKGEAQKNPLFWRFSGLFSGKTKRKP